MNKFKIEIKKRLRPIKPLYNLILYIYYISHRFFKKPNLPINKDGRILIHLGCGNENDSRYINVDVLPLPHIHYVTMVEKLPMFPDDYADLVYASHVLEHISHKELINVLKEWRRIIKIGGVLRLSVPDFNKIVNIYEKENKKMESIIMPLMGGQDYTYNFHKSMFDEKFLIKILSDIGFREIKSWDPNIANYYNFNDWANKKIVNKYLISLNIEAVK